MSILSNRYFTVFILMIAVLIILLIQPRSILTLQELFDVPGHEFSIGDARIARPVNWVLTSSRRGEGHQVRYFGFLPEWIYKGEGLPEKQYFTFESVNDRNSSFTFIETDEVKRKKIAAIVADVKPGEGGCTVKNPALAEYSGVECTDETSTVIYLPDLGVTIVVLGQSLSQLSGLKISKAGS